MMLGASVLICSPPLTLSIDLSRHGVKQSHLSAGTLVLEDKLSTIKLDKPVKMMEFHWCTAANEQVNRPP